MGTTGQKIEQIWEFGYLVKASKPYKTQGLS